MRRAPQNTALASFCLTIHLCDRTADEALVENIVRTQLAFREGAGDNFALKLDLNFNFRTEVTALLPFVNGVGRQRF